MCQSYSNGGQSQAAVLSRVSTEEQGERGTSLETQEVACVTLAQTNGYNVPLEYRIREEFTGATLDRPGLQRLRQLVRDGDLDTVVYTTLLIVSLGTAST